MLHEKRRLRPPPMNEGIDGVVALVDTYFNAYNAARIKLEDVLRVMEDEREAARNEIHLEPEVLEKARLPLERMIELSQN